MSTTSCQPRNSSGAHNDLINLPIPTPRVPARILADTFTGTQHGWRTRVTNTAAVVSASTPPTGNRHTAARTPGRSPAGAPAPAPSSARTCGGRACRGGGGHARGHSHFGAVRADGHTCWHGVTCQRGNNSGARNDLSDPVIHVIGHVTAKNANTGTQHDGAPTVIA